MQASRSKTAGSHGKARLGRNEKTGRQSRGRQDREVQQVMQTRQTGKARFDRHVDALVKVRQANRAKAWDRE